MKIKRIINLVSVLAILLFTVTLIAGCVTSKTDNSINTNTNSKAIDNIDLLENEQRATASTSSVGANLNQTSTVSSTLPTGTTTIKTNIDLDSELKDLDAIIKGSDSKGFSDSDLNVN